MYMQELAEPSIKDAFDSCVQRGATRIIISPFFLLPGKHWSKVIYSILFLMLILFWVQERTLPPSTKVIRQPHFTQDIPALAAEAAKAHPGISYVITAPLGLHELLVVCCFAASQFRCRLANWNWSCLFKFFFLLQDVMNDRIQQCLMHVSGDADECSVCAGTGRCRLYTSEIWLDIDIFFEFRIW